MSGHWKAVAGKGSEARLSGNGGDMGEAPSSGHGYECPTSVGFYPSMSPSRIMGDSARQQTPYRCQSRNHGLCASISSCLRFAAQMSLGLSGLISGASNISCSCSISSMMRSTSMRDNIQHQHGKGQTGASLCFSESFILSQLICQRPPSTVTQNNRSGGVPSPSTDKVLMALACSGAFQMTLQSRLTQQVLAT